MSVDDLQSMQPEKIENLQAGQLLNIHKAPLPDTSMVAAATTDCASGADCGVFMGYPMLPPYLGCTNPKACSSCSPTFEEWPYFVPFPYPPFFSGVSCKVA